MGNEDRKEDVEEVVDAIKNGLTEANDIIKEIGNKMMDCANLLRVEQSYSLFTAFSEIIKNLSDFMEFIKEVRRGVEHLNLKGYNVSMEPLLYWDRSLNLFKETLSAFESQDWITLSDLMQYELHPLLLEGEKGLSDLKESLQ
ncbi:MAG: hypothetical protein HY999_06315 [Nitrospinae bacterium]|nr:hypothetical protein [Nitrospinota bacterium]